jgi:predicted transposase/invertase (TIGR01784 family)
LKIGLYLEKVNPHQNWQGVVIYPSRTVEQENLYPYRGLLQLDQMTRIYLDELSEPPVKKFGFGILRLIVSEPDAAANKAKQLIPRVRLSGELVDRQRELIELIETIVSYKFPTLSRKELERMLQVNDFRETKIYQEARAEGREEGLETVACRMLEQKLPLKKIVDLTGLSLATIKRLQKTRGK